MKKTRLLTSLFALALLASCGGEPTTNTATTPATTTADTATTDTGATTPEETTPEQTTPEETTPEETTADPSDTLTKEMVAELKGGLALQGIVQTYFVDYEMGWYELYELAGNNENYYSAYADLEEKVDEETGETIGFEDPEHYSSMFFQKAQPFTKVDSETGEEVTYEDMTAVVTLGLDNKVHEQHPFSFSDGSYYAWADTGFSAIFDGISASDFVADEDYFEEGEGEGLYAFTADFDSLAEGDDELKEYYDGITSKVVDFLYGSVGNYPLNTLTFVTDGYHIVSIDAYSYQPDETGSYGDTWQKFVYDVVDYGADVEVLKVEPLEKATIPELDQFFASLAAGNYSLTAIQSDYDKEAGDFALTQTLSETVAQGFVVDELYDKENALVGARAFGLGQTTSGIPFQQNMIFINGGYYFNDRATTAVTEEFLTFDISSAFFTENDFGEYVFDYAEALETIPGLDTSFDLYEFNYALGTDFDKLTINPDGVIIAESAEVRTDMMFSGIGQTTLPNTMIGNGDNLTWVDLIGRSKSYEQALTNVGGQEVLDMIPVLGGYYNNAGLFANNEGITQIQYKLGPGSMSYAAIDAGLLGYTNKLTTAGYTMVDEYDPENEDDPWHVEGTKEITIEDKKYDLTVEFFVASDKQNNFYFIIAPSIAEHVDPLPIIGSWYGDVPNKDPETGDTIDYQRIILTINNDLTGTFGEDAVTFTENNGTYTYEGDKYSIAFTYNSELDAISLQYKTENEKLNYSVFFIRVKE